DLADVLELGGEPGHPPQRVPLLQVHLPGQVGYVGLLTEDRAHCPPRSVVCSSPDGAMRREGFHFINTGAGSYVPGRSPSLLSLLPNGPWYPPGQPFRGPRCMRSMANLDAGATPLGP